MTDFLNLITIAANDGKAVISVFLDMSKAFDRVSHIRLLSKAKTFGIVDPLYAWLESYLSLRSQVVNVDGTTSTPSPVTSGVIQGIVLGPLVFLMYINDIFTVVRQSKASDNNPFVWSEQMKIRIPKPAAEHRVETQPTIDLLRVRLTIFDGRAQQYCKFIEQLKTIVENTIANPGQTLLHLTHCCQGRAKEATDGWTMLDPNQSYERTRKILEDLFGQPFNVAPKLIESVLAEAKWPEGNV